MGHNSAMVSHCPKTTHSMGNLVTLCTVGALFTVAVRKLTHGKVNVVFEGKQIKQILLALLLLVYL